MVKKLSLKTIMFAVIAIAMFVCGISTLASFADIKPANVEKQIETKVSAEGNEARIGTTEYTTLEEAFAAANEMTDDVTIYCIASDIVVDSQIACCATNVKLLCDGTNVTITRNFDNYLFYVSRAMWKTLTIGETTNDEYQFTINGNNKAYPLIRMSANQVVVNCGTFMGNADGIATVQSKNGGFAYVSSSENSITINGGTFKNFYADNGGVICHESLYSCTIKGGTFINNKALFGGVVAFLSSEEVCFIEGAVFENNSAVLGGVIACVAQPIVIVHESVFKNNIATGDDTTESGIGNDIFVCVGQLYCFDASINDIAISSLAMASFYAELNCFGGTIGTIKFAGPTLSLNGETAKVDAQGTINIYNDFDLTGSIKLDGADGQVVNVAAASEDLKTAIKEGFGIDVEISTSLANTYKIDGSAENFASYYQDTGKAIVTYADGIEVDKNDFTCTNGSIITSAQVEGGSASSLYLTAPSETTPSTGFVDEHLLPALAIGFVSILVVAYVVSLKKKCKILN